MQGVDPSMGDISIPVYGPVYLKILVGQDSGFICSSIQEFMALKQLNENCGTVAITLNLMEMDILTLVGSVLTFTPNTGMNFFMKLSAVDLLDVSSDVITMIADASGIPMPEAVTSGLSDITEFAGDILQAVFDKLVDYLDDSLGSKGIAIREWEELPVFFNEVKASGEMAQMRQYRQQFGAMIM
jgi:hypothetical protein